MIIVVSFIVVLCLNFVNMFHICENSVYYRTDTGM
jgi:hypothetical protein